MNDYALYLLTFAILQMYGLILIITECEVHQGLHLTLLQVEEMYAT